MWINHLAQADLEFDDAHGRFWMDTCGGRDQVAMTLLQQGWAAYEPPLPALVASWCHALRPVFIDVGANTGFYSLLALAAGADHVHAFEPVAEIAEVLAENAAMSELAADLTLHRCALGAEEGESDLYFPRASHDLVETSASLNPAFRGDHEEVRLVPVARLDGVPGPGLPKGTPVLLKLDVESHEPAVLAGAVALLRTARPAVVCEMLPGVDLDFYRRFFREHGYGHYALTSGKPVAAQEMVLSMVHRDHLFLPREAAALWLAAEVAP